MTARSSVRALLMGSAATFMISTPLAQAQDAAPIELAPIVVDSKREVLTDTATATTVVDAEEIQDRQAGTIAELVDSAPGVNLVNGGSPVGMGINIRGFGATGSYGTDGKVGIQLGGATKGGEELYRLSSQVFTDPQLFREVAVTRGMGGTLQYGSGYFGGLLMLEPIQASDMLEVGDDFALRQLLEYGTNGFGYVSSTTMAWRPTDNFEVLGNFTWRHVGIAEDANGSAIYADETDLPSYTLNSRLTFGNADEHALTFMYMDTNTDEKDVPYDMFSTNNVGFPNFGRVNRQVDEQTAVLGYEWNPATNDLIDLEATLSYSDQEIEQQYIAGSSPMCDAAPASCAFVDADPRYRTTKLTLKNTSRFATGAISHELLTGIEGIHKNRTEASSSAPGGQDNRFAVFAQDTMRIGALTLTPELRYETSRIDGGTFGISENDAAMGGIGAHYTFGNGFALLGGLYYNESLPIIDDLGTPLYMSQPEKARTVEAGVAWDGQDVFGQGDALAAKLVAYQTNIWDMTSYSGITDAELTGVEIEAAYSMANGFYIDASANIVDGKSNQGAAFWERSPADELRVTLGKRWDDRVDLSYEMVAAADVSEGSNPSAGYTVHNLRATFRPEDPRYMGAEFRVGIENLGDKAYRSHLATYNAPGRTVKFSVVKTF